MSSVSVTNMGIEEILHCDNTGLHTHQRGIKDLIEKATNVVNDTTKDIDFVDYRLQE